MHFGHDRPSDSGMQVAALQSRGGRWEIRDLQEMGEALSNNNSACIVGVFFLTFYL